jgi:hypothetical protein
MLAPAVCAGVRRRARRRRRARLAPRRAARSRPRPPPAPPHAPPCARVCSGDPLGGPHALQLLAAAALALPSLPGAGVNDLFTNRVFLAGFWAWFTAQTLKVGGARGAGMRRGVCEWGCAFLALFARKCQKACVACVRNS